MVLKRPGQDVAGSERTALTVYNLNKWEEMRPAHFHTIKKPDIYHFRYNNGLWSVSLPQVLSGHEHTDATLKNAIAYVIQKAALRYGIDWSPYSGYRAYVEQSGKRGGEYLSTYYETESQALLDAWVQYLEPRPL